jgi:hypothetical protein
MDTFKAGAMIRFGWETFKKRPWFFVVVTILIGVFSGIIGAISASFGQEGAAQAVGSLANFVLGTFVGLGVTAFFLKAHDSVEAVKSGDFWHPQQFWSFLAVKLLTAIVVVIGLILLIVPGVMVALMVMFGSYLVVDKGMGPIEAMKESKRITDGHKWELLWFCILIVLFNILGAICLLVGLLVTVPVTSLAVVHAYRTLAAHEHPHAVA